MSTELEQQAICTVRRHLRLSLDELYIIFKPNIPKLSRYNLHRCLQYYGLSRLPKDESDGQKGKKKFKQYPVGFVHIDITEVRCETGKLYLFVAIDRKTKYLSCGTSSAYDAEGRRFFSAQSATRLCV